MGTSFLTQDPKEVINEQKDSKDLVDEKQDLNQSMEKSDKNGILDDQFNQLKELSFELFNILDLYRFESYFKNQKSLKKIVHLHIIIDPKLNFIPFEILHDGKDFLSDYLILSREFTNSDFQNSNHNISSKQKFCVIGNPSESKDILSSFTLKFSMMSVSLFPASRSD